MGVIYDLIFGNSSKPKVTKREWIKVKDNLRYIHHFSEHEANEIEEVFRGDMDETREIDKGIDPEELVRGIEYLRKNIDKHHIPLEKIDAVELEMMKYISKSS